jgi:hypothetical protein
MPAYRTGQDVTVLAGHLEVPGIGLIPSPRLRPARLRARIADTGPGQPDRDFVLALAQGIDPDTR